MPRGPQALPDIVPMEEWRRALADPIVQEKAPTRRQDALSAERQRLPMVRINQDYPLLGTNGETSLR